MRRLTIPMALVLMIAAGGHLQGQIVISQDTTIDYTTEEDVHIVEGADPPTVVEVVTPASLRSHTRVFDSSILNVNGGTVPLVYAHDSSVVNYTGGGWCSVMETHDASTANLSGGFNDLFAYGSSTVNLTGESVGEIWAAYDSSTMNIPGGGSDFLQAHDSSEVNISGGLFWPSASESSKVNVSGGTIALSASDSAAVTISGGTITSLAAGEESGAHTCVITVEGSGFNYPYGSISDVTGTLTGTLAGGDPINADFDIYSNASIVLVPEPSTGDFDGDGFLTVTDIDMLTTEVLTGDDTPRFDVDDDSLVNEQDHRIWIKDLKYTWFGDADLNGEFNSSDMVQVFAAGKYETDQEAGWAEGDWNGNGIFDSSDMVAAFADGGYEKGRGRMRRRCRNPVGGRCS